MRDEIIYIKIKDLVKVLDEIDDLIQTRDMEQQKIDLEISDWLHFIENNELNEIVSYKVVSRIHELRKKRRSLSNEMAIEQTYKNNSSKVMGNNTRQFLLAEISKTVKQLDNEYKNRVITEEDIQMLYENKNKKVGRPRKEKEDN